ncbi:hypothetical protein V495_05970 [Pseudogymnoascus sp. VKM F-4514 (FW-929)]|nr:hypothetical protein V495_05970 [Pseudogymnoascus sp. VKM F-4514 (FW-929)]KFY57834.1 hypothetical protein V497_05238 [Pseudogymnoascus sp. VKM F-4516 (FW-969)]
MDTTAQDSVCLVTALKGGCGESSQDIEEGRDVYRLGGFHPVYIGDVYHGRYEVLNKIGYGLYFTVWLARDLQVSLVTDDAHEFVALKFLTAEAYGTEKDIFERDILKHLIAQEKEQLGVPRVRTYRRDSPKLRRLVPREHGSE